MTSAAYLASALLGCLEGTRLTAYQDSGGVWTIGTGHTGPDVRAGMVITLGESVALLQKDSEPVLDLVAAKPLIEAAALTSFGYNCGRGALKGVLAGTDSLSNPRYTRDARGNVLTGLVARRYLEQILIAVSQQQAT